MRIAALTAISLLFVPALPAFAQDRAVPESLRLEESTTQQNMNDPTMPANRGPRTTTEAPGAAGAPIETKRIDPAAPSPDRLQIDDGASAAVRQNPDANALHPGSSGSSYNTILRGAPSSSGASGGTSGIGGTPSGSSGSASGGGR